MGRVQKPSDRVASVIDYSNPSAVWADIEANKKFVSNKGSHYVFIIQLKAIGGLSKSVRNDESKGQFVERVKGGGIHVYLDEELNELDMLIIVPDEETVQNISEFNFLSTFNKFQLAKASLGKGNEIVFTPTSINFSYEDLEDVLFNDVPFNEVVNRNQGKTTKKKRKAAVQEKSQEEISLDDELEAMMKRKQVAERNSQQSQQPSNYQDEYDALNNYDAQDEQQQSSDSDTINPNEFIMCPQCQQITFSINTKTCHNCGYTTDLGSNVSYYKENEDTTDTNYEVSEEETEQVFEQHLYSDDIDLVVTTEPFDLKFASNNKYIPIVNEQDGDGWLSGYVNEHIRIINAELKHLHAQNLQKSRDRFYQLLLNQCQVIHERVSYDDASNIYSQRRKELYNATEIKKKNINTAIELERDKIEAAWQQEIKDYVEAITISAQNDYIKAHGESHNDKLRDVEMRMLDNIEIEYRNGIDELNELRKRDAHEYYEHACAEALLAISDDYARMLDEEERIRAEYVNKIQAYVDKHRKEEIARADILAEQLQQQSEAERVAMDYEERIKQLTLNYDSICDKLRQDIKSNKSHEELVYEQNNNQIVDLKKRLSESEARYEKLQEKYQNLDVIKAAEYDEQIKTVINDKNAALEHLSHVNDIHKRNSVLSIALWGAVAVAMLVFGMFIGSFLNLGKKDVQSQQPAQYELNIAPEAFSNIGLPNTNNADNQSINDSLQQNTDENGNIVIQSQ